MSDGRVGRRALKFAVTGAMILAGASGTACGGDDPQVNEAQPEEASGDETAPDGPTVNEQPPGDLVNEPPVAEDPEEEDEPHTNEPAPK